MDTAEGDVVGDLGAESHGLGAGLVDPDFFNAFGDDVFDESDMAQRP
jgi:hypothetical protein